MNLRLSYFLYFLFPLSTLSVGPPHISSTRQPDVTDRIISAYYPGYNADYLPVEKIPWKMYNHLQYFVAVPAPTPEADLVIDTEENMIQVIAGAKAHNVSISLTVGGWTGSKFFSFLVGDHKNRTAFAETISRTIKKYGLDGIEIDWEFPNEQVTGCNAVNKDDSANFLAFLQLLRSKLGSELRISAAVSMLGILSPDGESYLTDVREYGKVIDFLTIMAYDVYQSSSAKVAGPNAPLFATCSETSQKYSAAQAIHQWISTGIPAHKLLLGIPAYGYGYTLKANRIVPTHFSGMAGVTSGLFQPCTGVIPPAGSTSTGGGLDVCGKPDVPGGQWLFRELMGTGKLSKDQKKGLNGYVRHYDDCTQTPFLFNPSTRNLISYDDSYSLQQKASYALSHGLAGVVMFDATGDTSDSQLLRSVRQVLIPHREEFHHGVRTN